MIYEITEPEEGVLKIKSKFSEIRIFSSNHETWNEDMIILENKIEAFAPRIRTVDDRGNYGRIVIVVSKEG